VKSLDVSRSPVTTVRIVVIGSVGVPARYGGFESLVETLLDHTPEGVEYTVFCSSQVYPDKVQSYKGAQLKYLPLNANGIQSILYDVFSLMNSIKHYDVVLVLGVSGALFFPVFKILSNTVLICNIDGLEWRRSKWNFLTKYFLRFSEQVAVRSSDIVIADNKGISDHVFSAYGKEAVVIAYGADFCNETSNHLLAEYSLTPKSYYFKVARIEPENNLLLILRSFSSVPSQKVVIVGNWSASDFGQNLKRVYSKYRNIILLDPIYNLHELNELRRNCLAYIHGHSAGGTNPSLVEAMALKLPIFSFDVNFNRYTLCNRGFYFSSQEDLVWLINNANLVDLVSESEAVFDVYTENYKNSKIAKDYLDLFKTLVKF
jgi:glycosyltransferase involved in cell wall biosynthesis